MNHRNKLLKRSFSAPNYYDITNTSDNTKSHNKDGHSDDMRNSIDDDENRMLNMTNKFLGSLNDTKLFSL